MLFFFLLLPVSVANPPQDDSELLDLKRKVLEQVKIQGNESALEAMDFAPNEEAVVLVNMDIGNGERAYQIEILNKTNKGVKTWIKVRENDPRFKFYEAVDSLSSQTLDITKATHIRSTQNFSGLYDITGSLHFEIPPHLEAPRANCNLEEHFPISLSSDPRASKARPLKVSLVDKRPVNPCPNRPTQANGKPCVKTLPVALPKNSKLRQYILEAAEQVGINPAFIAAMIAQESQFRILVENKQEKEACRDPAKCPKYGWSKGMIQFGRMMSDEYGLDWEPEIPTNIPECNKNGSSDACVVAVDQYCEATFISRDKKPATFCPRQALVGFSRYIKDILERERKIRVKIKDTKKNEVEAVIDLSHIINEKPADQLRYAAGDYNRGPRVDNSIEQYFQQKGTAPPHFGHTWAVRRNPDETPSKDMGYRILNNEYINRCYVWNIAGLCGNQFPPNSLATYYSKVFAKKKERKK